MIEKISSENPLAQSAQMIPENMARLAELFPDAFADGKVNVQKLLENIGVFAENEEEKFGLNWSGKQKAKQIALAPTNKTLRPNKNESKNWDTTENLYIEGDNLEVLKLLQKAYAGQIKMIYIDPPYNTGKDFVYSDKFAMANKDALVSEGLVDDDGSKIKSTDVYDVNTKNSARYHTNWLNMMYPRMRLARNLLKKDGVIFVSIDDTESSNLKTLLDEVFGEENFVADIAVVNNQKGRNDKKYIATANERVLMYTKHEEFNEYGLNIPDDIAEDYKESDNELGPYRLIELRKRGGADTREERKNMYYPFFVNTTNGSVSLEKTSIYTTEAVPVKSNGVDGRWRWGKDTALSNLDLLIARKVQGTNRYNIYEKDYLYTDGVIRRIKPKSVMAGSLYSTDVATKQYRALMGSIDFSNPKPVQFVSDLVLYSSSPIEPVIILDFFSGSATTAHAVMQLNAEDQGNRKFILVQIPEACAEDSEAAKAGYVNICEIGKERIRRAGEKVKSESADKVGIENLDIGFRVFKLDTSNIKEWNTETDDLLRDLFNHQDHLNEKRSDEDILFELMLKLNRPLTAPIETKKIAKQTVFCVDGGALMVCLPIAKALTRENVESLSEGIIKWHQETGYISGPNNQAHFVFRDTAFADDVAKANLSAIFEQAGYNNLRSL